MFSGDLFFFLRHKDKRVSYFVTFLICHGVKESCVSQRLRYLLDCLLIVPVIEVPVIASETAHYQSRTVLA